MQQNEAGHGAEAARRLPVTEGGASARGRGVEGSP